MTYYTYLYRDVDGTPIYVGKGKNKRAWKHFNPNVKTQIGYTLRKRKACGFDIKPENYIS